MLLCHRDCERQPGHFFLEARGRSQFRRLLQRCGRRAARDVGRRLGIDGDGLCMGEARSKADRQRRHGAFAQALHRQLRTRGSCKVMAAT